MVEQSGTVASAGFEKRHIFFSAASSGVRNLAIFVTIVNLLIPPGIMIYGEMIGKNYWSLFWGEDNLITWFSSVQLIFIGLVAYLNYEASALMCKLNINGAAQHQWIWVIFMLGFIFLALDERFRIHEMVRDEFLRPGGIFVGLSYLREGDIGLYFYFIVGLAFSWFLLTELRRYPLSLIFFAAALIVALSAAVIDGLPEDLIHNWPNWRFWTSAYEEAAENWAQLLFLLSFLVILRGRLQHLGVLFESEQSE